MSVKDYEPKDSDKMKENEGAAMVLGYLRGLGVAQGLEAEEIEKIGEGLKKKGVKLEKLQVSNYNLYLTKVKLESGEDNRSLWGEKRSVDKRADKI